MKTHSLKTVQPYFEKIWDGLKNFELRKNDRDFQAGDKLIIKEYDAESDTYSGRIIEAGVDYMLKGVPGIHEDYCILSIFIIKRLIRTHAKGGVVA